MALSEHPWLFEYHWRRRPLRRLLRTWREALRPRRFWRDVRLTDPVHLRPLLVVVGGSAALVFSVIVASLAVAAAPSVALPGGVGVLGGAVGDAIWIVGNLVPGALLAAVAMPLAFVLLPQTLRRARVRRGHVVRIWLYSLFGPLTLAGVWSVLVLDAILLDLGSLAAALNPLEWERALRWRSFPFVTVISGAVPGTLLLVLLMTWLAHWWSSACRSYLKLPHSGWVVLALCVVVGLAGLCVQWWIWLLVGRGWRW